MKKHLHKEFEIQTEYTKNNPGKVLSAKCTVCGKESIEIIEMFQSRENQQFELLDLQKGEKE
jgi:hypothetical protein